MTCEGPDRGGGCQNMQHNTTVLRIAALLNIRKVAYITLLTAPEQNLDALR